MVKNFVRKFIPERLIGWYHFALAGLAAVWYGFPSRKLHVIGITGTKGKSTVSEMVNSILEADGRRTTLVSTIRFKVNEDDRPNRLKMTMPGRFFLQKTLAQAVKQKSTHAILEMTSEGVKLWRHRFIDLDALIFTNLTPEHIESHGSFENYKKAKLAIARRLVDSKKTDTLLVTNADDPASEDFLAIGPPHSAEFTLEQAKPHTVTEDHCQFSWQGEDLTLPLGGSFNLLNALAAATLARELGIPPQTIKKGLENITKIPGRFEYIKTTTTHRQPMTVVVDYAHTPESLTEIYKTFDTYHRVCVLGNTGGGRDKWKRPVMGKIANEHCDQIFLTNEDPYDENPEAIVSAMAEAITDTPYEIILDRRKAIRKALEKASHSPEKPAVVLITGKGTDPYIMEKNGRKTPWNDAKVTQEELDDLLTRSS